MATFPLPVEAEMTNSLAVTARSTQFGTGARQTKSGGINPIQKWEVSLALKSQVDRLTLETFLNTVGQTTAFQWRSPYDAGLENYRIEGQATFKKWNGGGKQPVYYTAQLTFRRVYAIV
jgi:phage-related protein